MQFPYRYVQFHLFYRHRFRQIPGLVDVTALHTGHIVGEQLQGQDAQAGQHEVGDVRHAELVVRLLLQGLFLAPHSDAQHHRAPGFYLPDIAHHLVEELLVGGDGDDQRPVLQQGDGAMLQLPGGVGLRVDIADLLQLQAGLQAGGIVHVPADEVHVVGVEVPGSEVLDGLLVPQALLRQVGQVLQIRHIAGHVLFADGAKLVRHVQGDHVDDSQLGAVGLGGGHGDLRARPGIEHVVRLVGDGAAHHVDDG